MSPRLPNWSLCLGKIHISFSKQGALLILFRFTDNYGNRFTKGFIKWFLEGDDNGTDGEHFSRYLFMKADLKVEKKEEDKNIWRVVWREGLPDYQDKSGTVATNAQCQQQMHKFVGEFGSPRQWQHDKCGRVHHRIWGALVRQYGYPVLERG
jgi:hypothetical protein